MRAILVKPCSCQWLACTSAGSFYLLCTLAHAWLKSLYTTLCAAVCTLQELLLKVLTDRGLDANTTISQDQLLSSLPDDKRHQVLAARGLLACGLLLHCLQSRHRVNYGINRSVNRPVERAFSAPMNSAADSVSTS